MQEVCGISDKVKPDWLKVKEVEVFRQNMLSKVASHVCEPSQL